MHLGNGAITTECAVLTASLAAAGLGYAAAAARKQPFDRERLLSAGLYGAAIFAAQMVNVPVLSFSSAHLVGGVLLAIALRPGLGALTMAAVLALQALLLGDGGIAALGANIINMALLPAALVAVGNLWSGEASTSKRGLTAGVQAAVAVFAAAGLIVIEVALWRDAAAREPLAPFAANMLAIHALIAAVEGVLTGALIYGALNMPLKMKVGLVTVATIGLLALLPLASSLPDGYEASAERSAWTPLLEDASENATLAAWQAQATESMTAVLPGEMPLAIGATLLAGVVCGGIGLALSLRRPASA